MATLGFYEGALPPIIPRGLFSLYDFADAKSRVRPGACRRLIIHRTAGSRSDGWETEYPLQY